ncbi:MAG TPA: hypothetical protein VF275_07070 [Gammaproteobacteria bacterium]
MTETRGIDWQNCCGISSKQTTNFEFDDAAFDIKTEDAGVHAVRELAWLLYDDLHKHKLDGKWSIVGNDRREVSRWILFLKSDLEYEWPVRRWWKKLLRPVLTLLTLGLGTHLWDRHYWQQGDGDVWPFLRRSDFEAKNDTTVFDQSP